MAGNHDREEGCGLTKGPRVPGEQCIAYRDISRLSPPPARLLIRFGCWLLSRCGPTLPSSGGGDRYDATQHYRTYRHISSHYVTLRYITLHYVNTGTNTAQWAGSGSTLSVTPPLNEGRWCAARGPPPRCWVYWL